MLLRIIKAGRTEETEKKMKESELDACEVNQR